MKKNILFILLSIILFSSCDDLFTPAAENFKNVSQMYTDNTYAQGLVVTAYRYIPTYYDNTDYATDDAVTNLTSNSYLLMATGSWTSSNNPVNEWTSGYAAIQYLNLFLSISDKVKWEDDAVTTKLFNMRVKGEAYGLRALFLYYLLRNHSGFITDGTLMGVPIDTVFQTSTSNFNLPRNTFEECVKQIYQDLDSAEYHLPVEYNDITTASDIPTRFQSITKTTSVYNRVMGHYGRQLFDGLIAKAIRTRTAILAASPAFQDSSNPNTWAEAADDAASIIDYDGGVSGLASNGETYYCNTSEISGLSNGSNPAEIIWRENLSTSSYVQELANFPPSLYGNGYMNPTQNLVDAFPMLNGYPIADSRSGYDSSDPYSNRDPRLTKYIIYNGSTEGVKSTKIYTGSQSTTSDGINLTTTSTRTGYYMKKRLRMDVNCSSSSTSKQTHYDPRIRYTEMFLDYAEAANEAWGPTGTGSHSYSAYDVIKAIRKRAGIGLTNGDPYLEECKTDQSAMRTLIHNERRLELCFEGFRFWDLRRWKSDLDNPLTGMDVNNNTYTNISVETPSYKDYMYYGPIPYSELLKYDKLVQNKGW